MSIIVQARDLRAEMQAYDEASELPEAAYMVTLKCREKTSEVVTIAKGEDEAFAMAKGKLQRIYNLAPEERVYRISERKLSLSEMLRACMLEGRVES